MKETGWNPTSMPTRETQLAYMRPEPGRSQREAAAFAVQTSEVLREPEISGTRGDRVTVCVETVKPDKKDDFDRLLREVIAPAEQRGSTGAWTPIRRLEPAAPHEDGTSSAATWAPA